MASKSDDNLTDAIWESANRLADDLDTVSINRLDVWVSKHSTTVKGAYLQDGITLVALALAWLVVGGIHPVIDGAIVLPYCFVMVNVVYRTMRLL